MLDQASQSGTAAASEIQPILESATFRKAVALRRLLVYLWENRHQDVTEYAIAVDALQRRPDFDPRVDATVRVHIARLRQKLKEYHESEGAVAGLVLTVPPGSYHIEVQERPAVPPELPIARPPGDGVLRWKMASAAASAVAVVAILVAVYSQRGQVPPQPVQLPEFWRGFWSNGRPVKLIIPTPAFCSWPGRRLRARDVRVDDFQGYERSAPLKRLAELFGPPQLSQSYTVTSDALGAVRLVQYLASAGRNLEVTGTGDLSLELFGNHNLIIMGFPNASPHTREFLARSHFATVDGSNIVNRTPAPGEPQAWTSRRIAENRELMPGIIAILPGQGPGTQVMLFSASHTAPLASFLISPAGAKTLGQVWAKNGSPPYFEAIVLAERESNSLVKGRLDAFHFVSVSASKQSVTVR